MAYHLALQICVAVLLVLVASAKDALAQHTDEGSNEKASFFENYFGFHEPMYFILSESNPGNTGRERLTFAKF
jgi:hypothetical protein